MSRSASENGIASIRVSPGPRTGARLGLASDDPELLLKARRGGRVLEDDALVGVDDALGGLGHQGRFVEAGKNELQLARIGVDVTDRKDAGLGGLELLGIDRYQVFVEV